MAAMAVTRGLLCVLVLANAAGCVEIAAPGDGLPYASADMKGILSPESWNEFKGKVSRVRPGVGIAVDTDGGREEPLVSVKFANPTDAGTAVATDDPRLNPNNSIRNQSAAPQVASFNIAGGGVIGGKLGIGLTTPDFVLDVEATSPMNQVAGFYNRAVNGNGVFIKTEAAPNSGRSLFNVQAQDRSLFVIQADGNVGIGATNPGTSLHVYDNNTKHVGIKIEQVNMSKWAYLQLTNVATNWYLANGGSGRLVFVSNSFSNAPMMEIDEGGNVGIGINPATKLDVKGDIHASGKIVADGPVVGMQGMCCASARTLKSNIRDLTDEDADKALSQLRPQRFVYKANPAEEKLGFIAEDVPDLVAQSDRKSLDPMDFVALLTKVVQEQQKELQAQRQRIERLEAMIAGRR